MFHYSVCSRGPDMNFHPSESEDVKWSNSGSVLALEEARGSVWRELLL